MKKPIGKSPKKPPNQVAFQPLRFRERPATLPPSQPRCPSSAAPKTFSSRKQSVRSSESIPRRSWSVFIYIFFFWGGCCFVFCLLFFAAFVCSPNMPRLPSCGQVIYGFIQSKADSTQRYFYDMATWMR